MNLQSIERSLGTYNPERAQRWEHFTRDEKGVPYKDIKDPFSRYTMETMLDNTVKSAMKAFRISGNISSIMSMLKESTTNQSPGIATFLKFAFPLIRRIWSSSIGKNLVSVQPMSLPVAKVFTLDHVRNTGGTRLDNRGVSGASSYADQNTELSTDIKELNMRITDAEVTATSKKLKAVHSIEVEQDLMTYHGIDINSELLGIMAREIAIEIDQQIIEELVAGAGAGNVNWNSTGSSTLASEVEAYKRTIKDAFNSASNLIFSNIYRDANFIVSGVSEIERLEQLGEQAYVPAGDERVNTFGRVMVGTLFGQYAVYKDPWFPVSNQYLVGHKGSSWLESGYVYAPYVPYMTLPEFTNPDNFSVTKAALSRQAFFLKNANNYATVTIISS